MKATKKNNKKGKWQGEEMEAYCYNLTPRNSGANIAG
jgi:hypothetical protein